MSKIRRGEERNVHQGWCRQPARRLWHIGVDHTKHPVFGGQAPSKSTSGPDVDSRMQRCSLLEFSRWRVIVPIATGREAHIAERAATLVLVARQLVERCVKAAQVSRLSGRHRVPSSKAMVGRAHGERARVS
eukprot:scaffold45512_cov31-Tisochrysis_lutea.AAC.5